MTNLSAIIASGDYSTLQHIVNAILLDSWLCDKLHHYHAQLKVNHKPSEKEMIEILTGIQVHFNKHALDITSIEPEYALQFILKLSALVWKTGDMIDNFMAMKVLKDNES